MFVDVELDRVLAHPQLLADRLRRLSAGDRAENRPPPLGQAGARGSLRLFC